MSQSKHLNREHFDQHIAEVFDYMKQPVDGGSATSNRGWDVMTQNLVESLTEDHVGAFDLPDVFERAMERVWEHIEYNAANNPQDLTKTYYVTELINRTDEAGPRIYVETFSYLSQDKWSLATKIGLLTNNHSIGSTHITEDEKENNLSISESGEYRGIVNPTTQLHVTKDENTSSGWSAIDNRTQAKLDKEFPPASNNGAMNSFKETPMDVRQQGQFTAAMDQPTRAWQAYTEQGMSKDERMARGKANPLVERIEALEHDLTEVMAALVSKNIMKTY